MIIVNNLSNVNEYVIVFEPGRTRFISSVKNVADSSNCILADAKLLVVLSSKKNQSLGKLYRTMCIYKVLAYHILDDLSFKLI